jgi:regulatory protein
LLTKLQRRQVEESLALAAIDELAEQNLQSDQRYAESHARQRVARAYGFTRIRAELRNKGIDDDLIAAALADYEDGWYALARDWVSRKHRGELDEKARARLYRGGMNRGFSHDQVMRAIDGLRDQLQEAQAPQA